MKRSKGSRLSRQLSKKAKLQRTLKKQRVLRIHPDAKDTTHCPGRKVVFPKSKLPMGEYISRYDVPGINGCDPTEFMRYNDGRYCCDTERADPQQILSFTNNMLYHFFNNEGFSSSPYAVSLPKFRDSLKLLEFLKGQRRFLLFKYPTIEDDLELPLNDDDTPLTLEEWEQKYKSQFAIPAPTQEHAREEDDILYEIDRKRTSEFAKRSHILDHITN
jgi:hypothetical protein